MGSSQNLSPTCKRDLPRSSTNSSLGYHPCSCGKLVAIQSTMKAFLWSRFSACGIQLPTEPLELNPADGVWAVATSPSAVRVMFEPIAVAKPGYLSDWSPIKRGVSRCVTPVPQETGGMPDGPSAVRHRLGPPS